MEDAAWEAGKSQQLMIIMIRESRTRDQSCTRSGASLVSFEQLVLL